MNLKICIPLRIPSIYFPTHMLLYLLLLSRGKRRDDAVRHDEALHFACRGSGINYNPLHQVWLLTCKDKTQCNILMISMCLFNYYK